MRSIVFRYPDLAALEGDFQRDDPELPLPADQKAADGEWVLAVFNVDGRSAGASAARVEAREDGSALVFEPRDWERLALEAAIIAGTTDETPKTKRGIPLPEVLSNARSAPRTPRVAPKTPRRASPKSPRGAAPKSPRSKRAPKSSARAGGGSTSSRKSVDTPPRSSSQGRARGKKSMPPPSQRASVLTRTLMPPTATEIHEADAPDHTLEAPIDPGSFSPPGPVKRVPRILVVDDDPFTQEIMREMLEAIGIEADGVGDGEQALDRLVLEPFDLVVLDWNLPGMNGVELCREIRHHPRLSNMPILFLTAQSSSRDLVDAFAAGADDFVAKPFRAPELGARLLALLRRAKIVLSSPPPAK